MRWMGCTDVLWMGADMDACKEKHKGKKKDLPVFQVCGWTCWHVDECVDMWVLKRCCRVWVAATSDEVHSTQGLLEAQGDSQRL